MVEDLQQGSEGLLWLAMRQTATVRLPPALWPPIARHRGSMLSVAALASAQTTTSVALVQRCRERKLGRKPIIDVDDQTADALG